MMLHEYRVGESRDIKRDFAFCRGQSFSLLRIEDPYVLARDTQYQALNRFLGELAKPWQNLPKKIEIKTRDTGAADQMQIVRDLESDLNRAAPC